MDKRSRRCYEDLPASVDAEYEDRFRVQYWFVTTISGYHFCIECYLPWQLFHRSRKQTNIEITIKYQPITLWSNLCYWFGIKVSWNMHVYTSLTGGQLFLMWIQNIIGSLRFLNQISKVQMNKLISGNALQMERPRRRCYEGLPVSYDA